MQTYSVVVQFSPKQSYSLVRFTWESGKGNAISTYEDFPARNDDFKLIA
jgi:hypothetical protein